MRLDIGGKEVLKYPNRPMIPQIINMIRARSTLFTYMIWNRAKPSAYNLGGVVTIH